MRHHAYIIISNKPPKHDGEHLQKDVVKKIREGHQTSHKGYAYRKEDFE